MFRRMHGARDTQNLLGARDAHVIRELVDAKTIKEGRFDIIEDRARQYLAVIAKARAEIT